MPTTHTEPQTARRVAHPAGAALARHVVDVCMACHSERWVSLFLCQRRPAAPSDLHGCDPNPVDKFDVRPKPTSSKTRAMAAKETHIATLQDARSSCYFGCDTHGEERRSRLTTFSGCDLVVASDSVAMIGSPSGVGLATMWLERRKLISLPVIRDWAANDRAPLQRSATPPLPSRPFPAPAPAEIVPWFPPPPAPSSNPGSSCYNESRSNEDSGAVTPIHSPTTTPILLADEELEATGCIFDEAPSKRQRRAGASPAMEGVQTPPPRSPIKRSPVLITPPSRELLRGGSETPPRRSLPAAWDLPDSDELPLQQRGTFGTFDLGQPSPTSFSPIALPLPMVTLPAAPLLVKPVARAFWRR